MIIGVPVKNDLKCFKLMIESLFNSTESFDKLIIIDGGSTDGTWEFCDYLKKVSPKVEVYHLDTKSPLEAYNKLFEIAKKRNEDLLITQSDVVYFRLYNRDWLKEMQNLASHPEIGLVVPLNGGGISGDTYLNGLYWVGGWCTFISKKCWEIFEKYDENYSAGYGVDIDMTYNIAQHYKVAKIDYWVDHHMQNQRLHDRSEDAEKFKKEASEYFRKKWKIQK